jgi:hypothetical protein
MKIMQTGWMFAGVALIAMLAEMSAYGSNVDASLSETVQSQSSTLRTDLEQGFARPPDSARPHVWWQWMNGNITKEGISRNAKMEIA